MAVKLGNGNWAVKEDKLLAYNDNSGLFFNKEFDFSRGSTATYVGRDGLIASAASGVPRIDFTNDTKGHLLLEPSRTNLLPYSEDFTQWTVQSGTTITSNTTETLSPSGEYNASKIVSNGSVGFYKQVAVTGVVSRSIYLKSVTGTVNVKLKDPALTVTTKTLSVTENWQRFELVESNGHASLSGLWIDDIPSSGIYAWGGQLESGDFSTSLIPTTGATSTRNADVCNNSGSAQDFNSEEGVLYAEIAALESTSSGSKFIAISDGTYNNRASILFSNGATNQIRCFLRVGGTPQVDKFSNVSNVKEFNKVAFSYKENEFKVFINGSQAGSTDTSGSVWSSGTITKLSLTEINSALGAFNGKVRNVQVFTEALTDEQLEKLTS
jgi:hypothetical protein